MKKSWSHLPNAHHIDWVLESVKEAPELWSEAWRAALTEALFDALDSAWAEAWDAARVSILALIAYDDCDQFLSMPYERLKVWAVLSENPRAVLLLQMVYVKEHLNEQSLVTLV